MLAYFYVMRLTDTWRHRHELNKIIKNWINILQCIYNRRIILKPVFIFSRYSKPGMFLADSTNGRAYATVLCQSVVLL